MGAGVNYFWKCDVKDCEQPKPKGVGNFRRCDTHRAPVRRRRMNEDPDERASKSLAADREARVPGHTDRVALEERNDLKTAQAKLRQCAKAMIKAAQAVMLLVGETPNDA